MYLSKSEIGLLTSTYALVNLRIADRESRLASARGVMDSFLKRIWDEGSKRRLETQLCFVWVAFTYFYVFAFGPRFTTNFDSFIKTSLFSLAVYPVFFYAFVKPDPLQWSDFRLQAIRFYQAQFPSLYLKRRCARCREQHHCPNFIGPSSNEHTTYWLTSIFRPEIGKASPDEIDRTLRRGYTCKLVFGTEAAAACFFGISLVSFAAPLMWTKDHSISTALSAIEPRQILFIVVCAIVGLAMRFSNDPSFDRPTGCWLAWREVNQGHLLWLENHEDVLTRIVCHAKGNQFSFRSQ
jgi:hypothetical protein